MRWIESNTTLINMPVMAVHRAGSGENVHRFTRWKITDP